jgi:hypothetical protein
MIFSVGMEQLKMKNPRQLWLIRGIDGFGLKLEATHKSGAAHNNRRNSKPDWGREPLV